MTAPATAATAWALVLDALRERIPAPSVALWVEPLELVEVKDNRLVLQATEAYVYAWMERRYITQLADTVREVTDFAGVIVRKPPRNA